MDTIYGPSTNWYYLLMQYLINDNLTVVNQSSCNQYVLLRPTVVQLDRLNQSHLLDYVVQKTLPGVLNCLQACTLIPIYLSGCLSVCLSMCVRVCVSVCVCLSVIYQIHICGYNFKKATLILKTIMYHIIENNLALTKTSEQG